MRRQRQARNQEPVREQAMPRVLVVDDEYADVIERLRLIFGNAIEWIGMKSPNVNDIANAIAREQNIKAILLDLYFPDCGDKPEEWKSWSGFKALRELSEMREQQPLPAIVILTQFGETDYIEEARKIVDGCLFFLRKADLQPDDGEKANAVRETIASVQKWTETEIERLARWKTRDRLVINVARLPNLRLQQARKIREFQPRPMEEQIVIVGKSPSMQVVYDLIEDASQNDEPVVIYGESGTGKELIARAIHYKSRRANCPFVIHNMAVIGEDRGLVQAQLFGSPWNCPNVGDPAIVGIFQEASNLYYPPPGSRDGRPISGGDPGTLFMDEFVDMPPWVQAMLLRIVEEKYAQDMAGHSYPADIRLICATNRTREEIDQLGFRLDLLNRLETIVIRVPSLNERLKECPEDIDLLIGHFVNQANRQFGKDVKVVLPSDRDLFKRPIWKGRNVRKLENIIRECVRASQGHVLMLTEEARRFLTETPEER
mgnify:CR=1 FL=1